jgi:hypothetical protein
MHPPRPPEPSAPSPADTVLRHGRAAIVLPIGVVRAAVGSFHPRHLPPLLRATYARELVSWLFLPFMLGAIEGGTIAIVVKKAFTGEVDPWVLNLAVTILTAAPNFANLTSFLWSAAARGRPKVPFISGLQIATSILVALVAAMPMNAWGLWGTVTLICLARTTWTGVITLRTAVWRNNYPKANRATIAGKMATVQSIVLAAAGWIVGFAMDANPIAFRFAFPMLAAVGLFGNQVYRKVRLRGQKRLARAELQGRAGPSFTLHPISMGRALVRSGREIWTTLDEDRHYRQFMWWMSVFGFGNLMLFAPLAIYLNDRFEVSYLEGILINTIIPLAVMPLAIPMWARLLDRGHVIEFRAVHGWTFVAASACMWLGALVDSLLLFEVAAVILGLGFAGGVLAWNLGHHDFAPAHKDSQYMAVHVTLNGLRGLLAPIAAYLLYEWLAPRGHAAEVFLICTAVNVIGVLGFIRMRKELRRERARLAAEAGEPATVPAVGESN